LCMTLGSISPSPQNLKSHHFKFGGGGCVGVISVIFPLQIRSFT
jgi:hypothetical protein